MLKNIKSIYFVKILFFHLNEERKLKLIKYNKSLQTFQKINLINYKLYSKRYIIYETNKEVEEYNSYNDKLLFEGEYSNGKRNGKGKEYDENEHLKFEGEYLNGKRNGKGKEYYENNFLEFEGEYLNGKKWKGNGYDHAGNIIYELNKGKGNVKEYYYYIDVIKYEGEYLNGLRNGKGKEYYKDGKLKFIGEYLNGRK